MRLRMSIATSLGGPVLRMPSRRSNDAAFQTRLSRPLGTAGSSHVISNGPRRVVNVRRSHSASA
jgi:hypothetical protein